MHSTGSLQISDRFGTRTKTFISTAVGDDRSLLEFTNPEEAGQKILRLDDEIYLYFPEAEEVIHLQGAALRENVLGSDFSYEDMTGESSLLDDYEVELEGTEPIDGHDCYRLRLTATRRDVVYPIQVVWIDAAQFVTRRVEQFSRRGRPLKEMVISDYREVGDKLIPVRLEMSDLMKKDSRTVFLIDTIEVDIAVDETGGADFLSPSSPWRNSGCIRAALHPGWLRCSSLTYTRICSFLAPCQPAPRRSRCHAGFHHGLLDVARGRSRRRSCWVCWRPPSRPRICAPP